MWGRSVINVSYEGQPTFPGLIIGVCDYVMHIHEIDLLLNYALNPKESPGRSGLLG